MAVAARHHRPANEYDPHQRVAGDLLGPGQAVIEHIAREELQKNDEGEAPKNHEGEPIFRMTLDHHLGVFGLDQALCARGRLIFTHEPSAPTPHRHAALMRGITEVASVSVT